MVFLKCFLVKHCVKNPLGNRGKLVRFKDKDSPADKGKEKFGSFYVLKKDSIANLGFLEN